MMPRLREFVPEGVKSYCRLVLLKLRYLDCFIGSPWIGPGVILGRRCSISRGVELGPRVSIGAFSYVNSSASIHSGKLGRFCSVGPHVQIGLAAHPVGRRSTSPLLYGAGNLLGEPNSWEDFREPPVIGSDVWIGASAFIRQGVRIGHGAVVGACAVVTHDVPAFGIVAGVPARLIRMRFHPDTIDRLLESRWWELEIEQIRAMGFRFDTPIEEPLPVAAGFLPPGLGTEDGR